MITLTSHFIFTRQTPVWQWLDHGFAREIFVVSPSLVGQTCESLAHETKYSQVTLTFRDGSTALH